MFIPVNIINTRKNIRFIMKSFKQFFTERQSGHLDLFLALAGDIKLDRGNACKIWEQCGKRGMFRHVTDIMGTEFLLGNKDKNLSISAMKFSKEMSGVETTGDTVLVVEGDYEIWWPSDAFTFIGVDGKRWISMKSAAFQRIFPAKFSAEYIKELISLKDKYPKINEFLEKNIGSKYSTSDMGSLFGSVTLINPYALTSDFENKTWQFQESNKAEVEKYTKAVSSLQIKYLDKYSDDIKKNLIKEFNKAKTDKSQRQQYYWDLDEAVISNVKVKQIIFKNNLFPTFVNELQELLDNQKWDTSITDEKVKRWVNNYMGDFESELGVIEFKKWKGPFTFRANQKPIFKSMKKAINNKKNNDAWDYLKKYHNIVRDKGVFLRKIL